MAFEKKNIWVIECRTGCTCCSSDNFTQGPYPTEEAALIVKLEYEAGNGNPLASQYSKHGVYNIEKWEIEILPDGRWIHEHNLFREGDDIRELLDSYGTVREW